MAVSTKIINRRIKSVASTRKITKAMELVSASKMRKAVSSVLATRPYATLAWRTVGEISARLGGGAEASHPLLKPRARVKKTLAVLITSDRGLCGGFNAQILRHAAEFLQSRAAGSVDFMTIGKRGEAWLRRRGFPIVASFGGDLVQGPSIAAVRPLARLGRDRFLDGSCDEVAVIYADFMSAIVQKPRSKILLPLRRDSDLGEIGMVKPQTSNLKPSLEYLFEPSPSAVLDMILPRILETQLYQAVLESMASEHSARMLAMRNATDSAGEMIDDLRFTFNQARQAGITREIAEISSGAAAIG
jgi:F-type H+-transporting ATPase subunit gamma